MTDKLMAGIDLHSNNLFCGIVDREGKRVFEKRLPCQMETVLGALAPFRTRLESVAVESTFNWYGWSMAWPTPATRSIWPTPWP